MLRFLARRLVFCVALVVIAGTAALAACSTSGSSTLVTPSGPTQAGVTFEGKPLFTRQTLHVYVANTEAQRSQGLMGVRSLPEGVGMAFVWSAPTSGGFWMKDTLIPLSVAFVSEEHRIVSIQEMTPCTADPCQIYRSPVPYQMAIEANVGWFSQRSIFVGDTARLTTPQHA